MRRSLLHPAAPAVAAALVLAAGGTAAANDWLPIFRTEAIEPVGLRTADLLAVPDLRSYGELDLESAPDVRSVASPAVAEAETGLDLPVPGALPAGVEGRPIHQVADEARATFLPEGLPGAELRLAAGPGVATVWPSAAGMPALVVARIVAPTAEASGTTLEAVRDHLLAQPGLPDEVATQLRRFTGDGTTLPLPVPTDEVTSSTTSVGGHEATVLATRDRSLAAVLWVEDGVLTVVAGSLGTDEVLEVARGLR